MKKIKLLDIQLENWRSISTSVNFNDEVTKISGMNGCGKSSIFHAWVWLLTSYTDPTNGKNASLFDRTKEITNRTPTAKVKATISIDDQVFTIERNASPVFTRDRETGELVKSSSDKYKTFIDGIEIRATAFEDWVSSNLCRVDNLRFCLDGMFLANLALTDRGAARAALESIIGEVLDEDYRKDYSFIATELSRFSPEEIATNARKNIKEMETRIDSLHKLCDDFPKAFTAKDEEALATLEKELAECIEQMDKVASTTDDEVALLSSQIRSKELLYDEKAIAHSLQDEAKIEEIKRKIRYIEERNAERQRRNSDASNTLHNLNQRLLTEQRSLGVWIQQREKLIDERDEIKGRVFFDDLRCSYCGQPLPPEKIDEMKTAFTKKKNEDLASVIERGKNCANSIDEKNAEIERIKDMIKAAGVTEELESVDELKKELKDLEDNPEVFSVTIEGVQLIKEIGELKEKLEIATKNVSSAVDNKRKELHDLNASLHKSINELKNKKLNVERYNAIVADIKKLSNDISTKTKVIHLCKARMCEKADIISERINRKLDNFRIMMWSELKNGALAPDCIVQDLSGVHYATLNNAHRLKACLELQKMFCKVYDITLPVFIDEASVFDSSNLPKSDCQTIYLFASDSPTLTIE